MTDEPQISDRERDILRLVATGATNQQIANDLNISINTVKVHLRNIFGKIGVVSRTEATLYAVRAGLVSLEREQPGTVVEMADEPQPEQPASAAEVTHSAPLVEHPAPPAEERVVPLDVAPLPPALPPSPPVAELERTLPVVVVPPSADPSVALPPAPRDMGRRPLWLALGVLVLVVLGLSGVLLMRPAPAAPAAPVDLPEPNDRWRELTAMPAPRSAFALSGFGFDGNNYFYVIGGEDANGVYSDVLRYDPDGNVWVSFRAKPTAVADVQGAVVGGRIFVPGGRTADGNISTVLEAYDPRRDSWEQLAALPEPRSRYGLSAVEGKIYLFGGWDGNAFHSDVWQYNPDLDAWNELTPMNPPRADVATVAVGDQIYVMGGRNDEGELTINQLYQPSDEGLDNPWTLRAPLPSPRASVSATVASNDWIFVLGGDTAPVGFLYNLRLDVWQPIEDIPLSVGIRDLRSQSLGNEVYIFGGRNESDVLRKAYAYLAIYTTLVPQT